MFTALFWLLFRTLRLRIRCAEPDANPYSFDCRERYIYSVWHDSMLMPVFAKHQPQTTALTSQHSDGSFVAGVLRLRNIPVVRGSTNRISTGSIRKMLTAASSRHLVITPDGPRGPNRRMSMGIVYLASRSGRAIVPTAFECSSCWRWKGSWSDLVIPKPFAKVILLAGNPIPVPADLSTDELRAYVDQVQEAMDQLDQEAKADIHGTAEPTAVQLPTKQSLRKAA